MPAELGGESSVALLKAPPLTERMCLEPNANTRPAVTRLLERPQQPAGMQDIRGERDRVGDRDRPDERLHRRQRDGRHISRSRPVRRATRPIRPDTRVAVVTRGRRPPREIREGLVRTRNVRGDRAPLRHRQPCPHRRGRRGLAPPCLMRARRAARRSDLGPLLRDRRLGVSRAAARSVGDGGRGRFLRTDARGCTLSRAACRPVRPRRVRLCRRDGPPVRRRFLRRGDDGVFDAQRRRHHGDLAGNVTRLTTRGEIRQPRCLEGTEPAGPDPLRGVLLHDRPVDRRRGRRLQERLSLSAAVVDELSRRRRVGSTAARGGLRRRPLCPSGDRRDRFAHRDETIVIEPASDDQDLRTLVEEFFRTSFATDNPIITEAVRPMLAAGGKRLRPRLTLLAAEAMGADATQHLSLASYMELIHVATLIHDDVVDHAETRRGVNATAVDFGNRISVLAGDYVFAWIFKNVTASYPHPIPHILSSTLADITDGEVLQLKAMGNLDLTVSGYIDIIVKKTATLFAASAECGAIMAGGSPLRIKALRNFGLYYGIAFQMRDDLLDMVADEASLGKPVGSDLRERKVTLPLISALQEGDSEFRADVERFFAEADEDRDRIAKIVSLIGTHGGFEKTEAAIATYIERAKISLAPLGSVPARSKLNALADALGGGEVPGKRRF